MMKRIILVVLFALLFAAFAGCGTEIVIDYDASMIGDQIEIADGVSLRVLSVVDTQGSDHARPERGYAFQMARLRIENNSDATIEISDRDFMAIADDRTFAPIDGYLNFVMQKMPDIQELEPGDSVTQRLIWMVPSDSSLLLIEFQPRFAQEQFRINMRES